MPSSKGLAGQRRSWCCAWHGHEQEPAQSEPASSQWLPLALTEWIQSTVSECRPQPVHSSGNTVCSQAYLAPTMASTGAGSGILKVLSPVTIDGDRWGSSGATCTGSGPRIGQAARRAITSTPADGG